MAYDPNDPADKAILDAAVTEALEEQAALHEADITGLKAKNKQLLDRITKLRQAGGSEGNAEEITRLEHELETANAELAAAQSTLRQTERDLKKVTSERDTANMALTTERTAANELVIENDLTSALLAVNVPEAFLDGAKALLGKGLTVKEVDGKRQAFSGDKPLSEFVKEWSESDKGKVYAAAPGNSGGNAHTNTPAPQGGSKKISEMTLAERTAHHNKVGDVEFNRQVEAERAVKP